MTQKLFTLLLFILPGMLYATNISGTISANTTWTKTNSPYILTGDLTIDAGAVLTVEPGVEVLIPANTSFYVDGCIKATGTPQDSVYFRNSSASQQWQGIRCRQSANTDTIIFSYCRMENADSAITATSRKIHASNNIVTGCLSGIHLTASDFAVEDNLVDGYGAGYGIVAQSGGAGVVSGNEVRNSADGYGIMIIDVSATVDNNRVHHMAEGILLTSGNPSVIINASGNSIMHNNNSGLQISGFTTQTGIHHNIIAYNRTGIHLGQTYGPVTYNTIKHNSFGLITGGNDNFYYNCIDSTGTYVVNANHTYFNLKNNYWGTQDTVLIYNKTDDYINSHPAHMVSYSPILLQPDTSCKIVGPPPADVSVQLKNNNELVVSPNPFTSIVTINNPHDMPGMINIYNQQGRQLYSSEVKPGRTTIDLDKYPAGFYYYRAIFKDNTAYSGKLLKQ